MDALSEQTEVALWNVHAMLYSVEKKDVEVLARGYAFWFPIPAGVVQHHQLKRGDSLYCTVSDVRPIIDKKEICLETLVDIIEENGGVSGVRGLVPRGFVNKHDLYDCAYACFFIKRIIRKAQPQAS